RARRAGSCRRPSWPRCAWRRCSWRRRRRRRRRRRSSRRAAPGRWRGRSRGPDVGRAGCATWGGLLRRPGCLR
ncbi:MAG: hypothetical protein AVDCRST_MAG30-1667, partial [uncultured Solirubrobacteraceae bacterium]